LKEVLRTTWEAPSDSPGRVFLKQTNESNKKTTIFFVKSPPLLREAPPDSLGRAFLNKINGFNKKVRTFLSKSSLYQENLFLGHSGNWRKTFEPCGVRLWRKWRNTRQGIFFYKI